MKRKSFWGNLKRKFSLEGFAEVGEIKGNKEWMRAQFSELLRLGSNPVVMKMGN